MRNSSFLSRLLWQLFWTILGISVAFFALSSYYFNDINSAAHISALEKALADGEKVLEKYAAGEMTRENVSDAVNPILTVDSGFFMLLDGEGKVIAYTDSAAPYFAGDAMNRLLERLKEGESAVTRASENGTTMLMMGEKSAFGYVVAGRPQRAFNSANMAFRIRLFFSMVLTALLILAVSAVLARRTVRPARVISEMAGRLVQGEQVTLPENLPGKDAREIAGALNDMSRSVAKAIADLKYEKENMSLIMEGLSEGILAVDGTGRILYENAAAWKLLEGEDSDACRAVMAALTENCPEDHWVRRVPSAQGMLLCAVSRLPREGGRSGRDTVALIRDVTEEERLERTRHDYVANISHELRTPLASIRGLGEGLRDGLVTEKADRMKYYSIIVEEAKRLSRLVNDLLELSSLQSNPAAFEMEKVDPNELIYDLHDRNGSLFTQKGVSFLRSLPDQALPPIRSNEDRLSQVLTIFLDNARKYTPEGGSVTLGAEEQGEGVRFFVRDTGIGMDEETRRLAFDRFHQAEKSRSDQGSGLGLAIAREIMEKMGLEIQVESAPGAGSEFSFTVPAGN